MNKIYIHETGVYLSREKRKSGIQVHFDEFKKVSPADFISKAGNGLSGKEITIWGAEPSDVFAFLSEQIETLVAAGGVVQNPMDEVLFIFRKNCWDFPKGKPEQGEDMETTALREVMEECGISGLKIIAQLPFTYHIYSLPEEEHILKKCFWYHMRSENWNDIALQTEEDITDARWVKMPFPEDFLLTAYPSIRDLAHYFQK
jgi:8-oxo-dGTP pyrophosphatase MutT (NUDIX family)